MTITWTFWYWLRTWNQADDWSIVTADGSCCCWGWKKIWTGRWGLCNAADSTTHDSLNDNSIRPLVSWKKIRLFASLLLLLMVGIQLSNCLDFELLIRWFLFSLKSTTKVKMTKMDTDVTIDCGCKRRRNFEVEKANRFKSIFFIVTIIWDEEGHQQQKKRNKQIV